MIKVLCWQTPARVAFDP